MIISIYFIVITRPAKAGNSFFEVTSFTVTLFSNNGSVIKKWENCSYGHPFDGGGYRFKNSADKCIIISGTYIVEEN